MFQWSIPIPLSRVSSSGWWFQTFFIFHNLWDVILPIDELHHFSRWAHCTTNQSSVLWFTDAYLFVPRIGASQEFSWTPQASDVFLIRPVHFCTPISPIQQDHRHNFSPVFAPGHSPKFPSEKGRSWGNSNFQCPKAVTAAVWWWLQNGSNQMY